MSTKNYIRRDMEKILFFRRMIPSGGTFKRHSITISALKITDKRIKGTFFGITMFEELLPEISFVKITPSFTGFQMEIKPLDRQEYYFSLYELNDLVYVLKRLNINVHCDKMEKPRNIFFNNPFVNNMLILFALAFLAFIVGRIVFANLKTSRHFT